MENITLTYSCRDLGEAAALLTIGLNLIELEKSGKYFNFVFKEKEKCEITSSAFWDGTLTVPAREYNTSIKVLKSRIYAGK